MWVQEGRTEEEWAFHLQIKFILPLPSSSLLFSHIRADKGTGHIRQLRSRSHNTDPSPPQRPRFSTETCSAPLLYILFELLQEEGQMQLTPLLWADILL